MKILAIDPGLSGAFARYDGQTLVVDAMPTVRRDAGPRNTSRAFMDELRIARALPALKIDLAVIEKVGGLPRQSAPAAFTFGRGVGFLLGVLAGAGVEIREVHASTWKAALVVPADKKLARARASELFPAYAELWSRAKDDGLAEAAMIALYAWQVFGPAPLEGKT